jgi:acyl-CoA reductase-like NAD-dependent aldehyde dehydrogenase
MDTVKSINPATGEVLAETESASAEQVEKAVTKAKAVQAIWALEFTLKRRELFERLSALISEGLESIANQIHVEAGKILPDAQAEVYDTLDAIAYFGGQIEKLGAGVAPSLNPEGFPETDARFEYLPRGVVALIMPWNFPFVTPIIDAIGAVMTGNSVILKPSEYTTMTGQLIGQLFSDAGFPEGLVQVLPGGDNVGQFLARADVDKIFFVGSIAGGQDVLRNAGLVPVHVELGGNSPGIVLADADLRLAAEGIAWAATYHSGQDCAGIKRVIVQDQVADDFIDAIVDRVCGLRQGIDYGPYITADAAAEVKSRIDAAVADGASLKCGGELSGPGNWLSPSVLVNVSPTSKVVSEETFGNVVPIIAVADVDTAVALANTGPYGLSAAVFSRDLAHAERVGDSLQAGMVFINDPLVPLPGLEHWTGWKSSGFGSVESKLEQFVKVRVRTTNKTGLARGFWYPYPSDEA